MNKLTIKLLFLSLVIAILCSCNKDTSTNNSLELKKKSISELIESYDLSASIQLTDDFNYSTSLEEVESMLQEIALSKQQELEFINKYDRLVEKLKTAYTRNDIKVYQQLESELNLLNDDKELSIALQNQIELDQVERIQQGEQYLEELKHANTKEDSIQLSKLFEFTLPNTNNSITSTRIETYQVIN